MKMKKITTRKPWTDSDVRDLCSLYEVFLSAQRNGRKIEKKRNNRALAEAQGRSLGSVECKMMNVSAVRALAGLDWVQGYKPLTNVNRALVEQVRGYFADEFSGVAA